MKKYSGSRGEIHVHLDGALDLLPDHRAAEIRAHLFRCEDCNARMKEERRIRERAAARAASDGATATEEEVEGRIGGIASGLSRQSWYRGLAWAATVVLSLGVGWYARSGVVETDIRARPVLRSPAGPDTGRSCLGGRFRGENRALPRRDRAPVALRGMGSGRR